MLKELEDIISIDGAGSVKILVVDDKPDNVELLSQILKEYGYDVIVARNGREAVKKAISDLPDLILLDIMLPEMDGYRVCDILTSKDETSDIPIIMITAKNCPEDLKKGFDVGAFDYIKKPFEEIELLSRVRSAIRLKQSRYELKKKNTELLSLTEKLQVTNKMLNQDIAKRKRVEQALQKSEERYRTIFENTGAASAIVEDDTTISLVNREFEKLTGYLKEEIEGKMSWTEAILPKDTEMMTEYHHMRRIKSDGAPSNYEFQFIDKEGNVKDALISIAMIPRTKKSIGSVLDITERKQIEKENLKLLVDVQERVKKLRCLYDIDTIANKENISVDGLIREIIEPIKSSLQYPEIDCCRIVFRNKEYKSENYNKTKWRVSEDLVINGNKVGFVEVCYLKGIHGKENDPFSKEEKELLKSITRRLEAIIDHNMAQEALRESEEKFRTIFENANDEIIYLDKYGTIIDVNKRLEDIFGYKPKDIIGKNFTKLEFFKIKNLPKLVDLFRYVLSEGEPLNLITFEGEHKNGNKVFVEASVRLVKKDGRIEGILVIIRDITERMLAENALRESEELFHSVVETANDAIIVIDSQGTIFFWNDAAKDIYGYLADEAIGEQITIIIPEKFRQIYQDGINQAISTGVSDYIPGPIEIMTMKKDGSQFPCEISSSFWKANKGTFFTIIARDITERKLAEGAIRDSEKRYIRLISGISGYTYSVKLKEGKPISTTHSSGCLAVTGYSSYEYELDPYLWFSMIHKDDRKRVLHSVNQLLSGEQVPPVEHRIIRSDEKLRWVRDTFVVKHDKHGNIVSYDGIVEDITERKLAEEELRKSKEELQKAYEELKDLDKMKTEFAAIATHEIGTPLSVISSNVEMLKEGLFGNLSDDQKKRLNIISTNTDHLIKLNREMMDISRMDAGKLKLKLESCCIGTIAKEIAYEMETTLAKDKKIDINLKIPDDLPLVSCDRYRMRQVFGNLINNAIKYTAEGGKIDLSIKEEENWLIIAVKDNGIGIPKEEQEKIFQRFYEIGDYLEHETGGAGLGLSIVKGIVEAHYGKVWVESEPKKGSTFYFMLPRC